MHNEFAKCEIKTSVFSGRKPPAGNYWYSGHEAITWVLNSSWLFHEARFR